jgi:hypothetical protein
VLTRTISGLFPVSFPSRVSLAPSLNCPTLTRSHRPSRVVQVRDLLFFILHPSSIRFIPFKTDRRSIAASSSSRTTTRIHPQVHGRLPASTLKLHAERTRSTRRERFPIRRRQPPGPGPCALCSLRRYLFSGPYRLSYIIMVKFVLEIKCIKICLHLCKMIAYATVVVRISYQGCGRLTSALARVDRPTFELRLCESTTVS